LAFKNENASRSEDGEALLSGGRFPYGKIGVLTQQSTRESSMDYTEMTFAIRIRAIALDMRAADRAVIAKEAKLGIEVTRWEAENPLLSFIPIALAHVKQVNEIIKQDGV
jgi:hypothetical protein